MRHFLANVAEQLRVRLDGVGAAHRFEHARAGVLQGQMKMRGETRLLAEQPDDLFCTVHRFEGADSKAEVPVPQSIGDGGEQRRQR